LDPGNPRASQAADVNASGHVVGSRFGTGSVSGTEAVLWTPGTSMTRIPVDDVGRALGSAACSINDQELIVGEAGGRAVLWQGNAMVDLNTRIPAGSSALLTKAIAINEAAQIVANGFANGQFGIFFLVPS
jgi:uncharacterized membrane protein